MFMEALWSHFKDSFFLKHGLGVGERQDFRGILDSGSLVHCLLLLLFNMRLWASYITPLGLSVYFCNTGMIVACSSSRLRVSI